jgi:hypothetical protein
MWKVWGSRFRAGRAQELEEGGLRGSLSLSASLTEDVCRPATGFEMEALLALSSGVDRRRRYDIV